jgi:hypothetical protein
MVELLVAGVMAAFVLGAVSMCLSQLADAKTGSRLNLEAHLRADAALAALRRDIVSVLRDADLFYTRLLLLDSGYRTPLGHMDRDEILVFNSRLRPLRDLDFMGDGMDYETQFRVEEDALGPVLWQRRDAVPDEYPRGGGRATPQVAGVVALAMEAYDGDLWHQEWDSDYDGLPLALRITVVASGQRDGQDPFDAPLATLRTVVPIDRVRPPSEVEAVPELAQGDEQADEAPGVAEEDEEAARTGRRGGGRQVKFWATPAGQSRGLPPGPGDPATGRRNVRGTNQ